MDDVSELVNVTMEAGCAGRILMDDLGDEYECIEGDWDIGQRPSDLCSALASSGDVVAQPGRSSNNRSQAVLQRWLDADCL